MKKNIGTVLFICLTFFTLNGQINDWPKVGWTQGAIHTTNIFDGSIKSNATFWVSKDTVVDNVNLRIVQSKRWGTNWLKIDGEKIYRISPATNYEQLIYDFGLSVGDEIFNKIVDSIGFKIIPNGQNAKFVRFENGDEWVQGIGDTKFALFHYTDFEGGFDQAVCTRDENNIMIQSFDLFNFDCDSVILDANIILETTEASWGEKIKLGPNPSSDVVYISHEISNAIIGLYSIDGNMIKEEKLSLDIHEVDLQHLQSGLYFIRISKGESLILTKLIFKDE